ncbi:hypothetical protein HX792_07850 [Pseudomonas sp. B6002]|uniref:hypothetical protein n=1 Tax=Pseudomonas sp. B6002 TaxID=2726978 RepID=UPI0015A2ECB3|nr:hypothetical protein [Pseudomonas sp. B6002]NVZ50242.1 hypothetical protein [Pseudomonas sp. B6002]
MVKVVEVVLELEATDFMNGAKATRGRVVREHGSAKLTCQVEDRIKGLKEPVGDFSHVDEARAALLKYWDACDAELGAGSSWQNK